MKAEYYKLLKEYINFKSISTQDSFSNDLENCTNRLLDLFTNNNFKVEKINKYGNPIIIASYHFNSELETGLIY
jgi:acetylornithine deacetylase/succinyl-diaminopimelate desuccinylase-like protein